MAPDPPYAPPRADAPHGHGIVARSLAGRRRRRRLVVVTSSITMVSAGALVLLFVLRPGAPPPSTSTVALDASAAAVKDPEAPVLVTLREGLVLVDGVEVARTDAIAASGRMQKVDGLYEALRTRHLDHPEASRKVLMDVAIDVPAIVVKSVFQTAAFAGYKDVKFVMPPPDAASP